MSSNADPDAIRAAAARFNRAKAPPQHAATSRARAQPLGNEEAGSQLVLGEFEGVQTLSLSEARLVINAVTDKQHAIDPNFKESTTLVRTQDWLDVFARFRTNSSTVQLEQLMRTLPSLENFERSQLGSLVPGDAEEAKTMIPSLATKITDEELKDFCDQMEELKKASDRDSR